MTKHYEISKAEDVSILKSWLGRECLHFILKLTEAEQESRQTFTGFFKVLDAKFIPKTI